MRLHLRSVRRRLVALRDVSAVFVAVSVFAWPGFAPTAARAEIVDIAWTAEGRFERRVSVAPGKFAEVCGTLARGESVAWRFEAGTPLDFNIHYHEGKDVRYPERREALPGASGELRVALDQDYCWMWTNRSAAAVALTLTLERRKPGR